jgi:ketosteroid isomerase-like protein
VAVTPTFGYVTAIQRYHGVARDGNEFDFRFRTASLLRKGEGENDDAQWKYVHEHFSFPVNLATQQADLSSGLVAKDNIALNK